MKKPKKNAKWLQQKRAKKAAKRKKKLELRSEQLQEKFNNMDNEELEKYIEDNELD